MLDNRPRKNRRTFLGDTSLSMAAIILTTYFSKIKTTEAKVISSKADLIVVWKKKRKLVLFHQSVPIKEYSIKLGFNPIGHKVMEGDGRTPEGRYYINRINLNSKYHKSLGISYPNSEDINRAKKSGVDPGGEIFIHGGPRKNWLFNFFRDWTAGCIAVSDSEIEEILSLVPLGTIIYIYE